MSGVHFLCSDNYCTRIYIHWLGFMHMCVCVCSDAAAHVRSCVHACVRACSHARVYLPTGMRYVCAKHWAEKCQTDFTNRRLLAIDNTYLHRVVATDLRLPEEWPCCVWVVGGYEREGGRGRGGEGGRGVTPVILCQSGNSLSE